MKCPDCGSKTQILESRQRKRIANANDPRFAAAGPTVFVVTNASTQIAKIASPPMRSISVTTKRCFSSLTLHKKLKRLLNQPTLISPLSSALLLTSNV